MYQYSGKVIRWVDGDTVWLDIDLGFYTNRRTDVRLAEVNTPERVVYKTQGGIDPAKAFNESVLPPGAECVVDILGQDKFGRWLAVIRYLPGATSREDIVRNGVVLNHELLRRGLAVPYKK